MLKIAQSTRPQFRRNLAAVAAASLFYASACPNVSHAQWFGPRAFRDQIESLRIPKSRSI